MSLLNKQMQQVQTCDAVSRGHVDDEAESISPTIPFLD